VLGRITVGEGARIGSGSVVVRHVPPGATVVGVPGRITLANSRRTRFESTLDHASLPDPVSDMIRSLAAQNERLRQRLEALERAAGIAPDAQDADDADGGDAGFPPVTHGG
jgi:serine O-acetyltransferase